MCPRGFEAPYIRGGMLVREGELPGGGIELRWARSVPGSEDGHTGISYSVVEEAESAGCRFVLVRLFSPGGVRHLVLHVACLLLVLRDPGLFFGLLGFRQFGECPVLGRCWWRVLASYDEDVAGLVEPQVAGWFRRFVGAVVPAFEEWDRVRMGWRGLVSRLKPAGVLLPGFDEVSGQVRAVVEAVAGDKSASV